MTLKNSLNAGVSCRKDRGRSNLGEQVHQVRDPPRIELLHRLDEPVSEIFIRERFAQPMELLHGPVPRHGIGQTPFVAQPLVTVVQAGPRHMEILRHLIVHVGTVGNLTSDAHLAALALEHGAQVCSCDHDFGRFPGLQWKDPIR